MFFSPRTVILLVTLHEHAGTICVDWRELASGGGVVSVQRAVTMMLPVVCSVVEVWAPAVGSS